MRISLPLVLAALWLAVPNRAAAADFPTGKFVLTGKNKSEWAITFDAKGKYIVTEDGKEVAHGTFKVTKDDLEVTDTGGPRASKGTGTYKWKLDGKKLTFTRVKDESGGRAAIVTRGVWEKKE